MKKWLIQPEAVSLMGDDHPATPSNGFIWLDLHYEELESCKASLQDYCEGKLLDLHLSEIANNTGQPYFDSNEDYDLLILSSIQQHVDEPPQLLPFAIICFANLIITVTHAPILNNFVTRLRQQKTKKTSSSKENFLHMLLNHIERDFLKLRDNFNHHLQIWRKKLLNSSGEFEKINELAGLQDSLRRFALTLEQQQEILEQWGNDEENEHIDFYKLNIHYHNSQFSRLAMSIQSYESKIESLLNLNYIAQGHYTNEILRVLAVISGIFLPLSFLTSLFGMNLNTLPLQNDEWASYIILTVMIMIAIILLYIFKKKKWL